MTDRPENRMQLEGNLVAELLDAEEHHSNIGNVAAVSDLEICFLRRTRHELVPFRLEYFDVNDCRAIEYGTETAWYRIVGALASFAIALFLGVPMVIGINKITAESGPILGLAIGLITLGVRLVTSTHRHRLRFEMPEETLIWRSPAIDFDYKAEAAAAVRNYARTRGIYKE